ncbi:unnamed protein product [Cercospora beticola]|nr:unnamed protein product [Cercospora beticola]
MFNRLMSSNYQLPDRVRASLLIRRVDRFIGNNYQLFLKKSFFRKFDETYASNNFSDVLWGCHLFALLALGELYSCYHAEPTNGKDVPGTAYFLQAITLLQDDYEHPSIEQIQVLLLLSFYANCIGRLQSAHVYCGIALRSSISLGLHRSRSTTTGLSRKDQEHRRRIWWTLYLFDRLISSKLGFPLGIRDEDIDVEMPSSESLTSEDQQEFHDPKHLCAHVKLSRITGSILTDVYCLPNHGTTTFVRRVHRVLNQLRKWDSELPSELRIQADNSARNLYTLHMHYHLCIIQTTRPILFHIFTTELQSSNATPSHSFSPTTLALADACKQSAMSTNHLLSRLFIDGNLAVFGYFDSHYIFSSTLILIIAGTMEPAAKLSEAVQMAFSLLGTMASNGNVSAKDYLRRLGKIQSSIITSRDASLTANASAMPSRVSPGITSEAATSRVPHAYQNESEHNWPLPSSYFQDDAVQPSDPLGNPFIEDFLAEKAFEWPSGPSPQQDIFRQFTHELGDELIFGF